MLKQFATNLRKLKLKTLLKRFGIVFRLHVKVSDKMRCRCRCRRLFVRKHFADVILIEFCCLMCTEYFEFYQFTQFVFSLFLWFEITEGKICCVFF